MVEAMRPTPYKFGGFDPSNITFDDVAKLQQPTQEIAGLR